MADLRRLDGADVYELAARYGVTTRSIRRDLNRLEALGHPLHREPSPDGKRVRYSLGGESPKLDAMHYLALRLVMGDGSAAPQMSALFATLEDLAGKIESAVGKRGRPRLAAIERALLPWHKHAYAGRAHESLWPIVQAIDERRICEISYAAAVNGGAARRYRVLPLRIFVHDRSTYLLARFAGHGEVGTLNLSRLRSFTATREVGEPPPDFDPARWAESAFSLVPSDGEERYVIQFTADAAPYIRERVWHPTQSLRELPGGGVELSFTGGDLAEVARWVVSWAEGAQVLEPAALRMRLRELGRWLTGGERSRYARPAVDPA